MAAARPALRLAGLAVWLLIVVMLSVAVLITAVFITAVFMIGAAQARRNDGTVA